ncbi:hypothetical protein [Tenacibaculum maritimum]|uniref:hypothetical protein n=1 Tax=Tenacibaculum maritimum TaxID=107401 RepID=UPI0012E436BA|nr:hypothetical protein [Tenacibaculum maritimum]CAA0157878.1 conserved hypothetical protein [Tenacibaculum maritimum]CAA0206446.1 conserved hypothetical protein [Tenacibaculum maritimum]
MIKKREKSQIIKVFGKHYSKTIHTYLMKYNVKGREGKPYTFSYIRMIVCGIESNSKIEIAILKAYQEEKKKLEKAQAKRNSIYNKTKKSTAATTDF